MIISHSFPSTHVRTSVQVATPLIDRELNFSEDRNALNHGAICNDTWRSTSVLLVWKTKTLKTKIADLRPQNTKTKIVERKRRPQNKKMKTLENNNNQNNEFIQNSTWKNKEIGN